MFEPRVHEEAIGLLSVDDLSELPITEKFATRPKERLSVRVRSSVQSCVELAGTSLLIFIPSFILSRWRVKPLEEKIRPTAYLDGLRGIAAWAVFNGHLSAILDKDAGAGFGHPGPPSHHELYKLPMIRLIYSGSFAVGLFFVISGFALSISPIIAMRRPTRDSATFMTKLSSTVFRRPMRLFLPSWVSTLIVFFLIRVDYFGAFERRMPIYESYVKGWQTWDQLPARDASIWPQLYSWFWGNAAMLQVLTDPTRNTFTTPYNGVLWTIKLEWRASLLLYLTHAALFPIRRSMRAVILAGLIIMGVASGAVDMPHFWAGFLIAEFSQLTQAEVQKEGSVVNGRWRILKPAGWWVVILTGAWIGSFPDWDAGKTPGFRHMSRIIPFQFQPVDRLWSGVGAALMIWALRKIPVLTKFLSLSYIQYLGKISFSLYLVHFWMVQGLGRMIFYYAWRATGQGNILSSFVGFCIGYFVLLGSVIWAADIFWRCVDIPLVNLGGKVQKHLFKEL